MKQMLPTGQRWRFKEVENVEFAGMASILLEPTEGLRFGLLYQSEVDLKLRGSARGPAGQNPDFNMELPLAQYVRFSAYWDATDKLALLFSAGWEDWSTMDRVGVDVGGFSSDVALGFEDTWRVACGLHYQLTPE